MPITDLESLRAYCLAKKGAVEDFPFDFNTLVFKVQGKMFALCNVTRKPLQVNLKCEPELAELLRTKYEAITPGYHMHKRHWNTLRLDDSVPDKEVRYLIDLSYELVVKKLKKADRETLKKL